MLHVIYLKDKIATLIVILHRSNYYVCCIIGIGYLLQLKADTAQTRHVYKLYSYNHTTRQVAIN